MQETFHFYLQVCLGMEIKSIDYQFANRLWVDSVFGKYGTKGAIRKIVYFSFVPFVLGIAISAWFGLLSEFLGTRAFYLGSIGILVTTWSIHYGSTKQYDLYDQFMKCFDIGENERINLIKRTVGSYSNFRAHVYMFLLSVVLGLGFVGTGFFFWSEVEGIVEGARLDLLRPLAFASNGWYQDEASIAGFAIVSIYSAFVFWPLATAASVISKMPAFMLRCSRFKTCVPPRLIKPLFAKATSFYSRISLVWIVGVVLFILLFEGEDDWLSMLILVCLFAFGLVVFIVPQVVYARVISRSEYYWFDRITSAIGSEQEPEGSRLGPQILFSDFLMTHDTWVYPIHHTYVIGLGYLLSFISLDRLINVFETVRSVN